MASAMEIMKQRNVMKHKKEVNILDKVFRESTEKLFEL